MTAAIEFGRSAAERFLRTVLVIDNELTLGSGPDEEVEVIETPPDGSMAAAGRGVRSDTPTPDARAASSKPVAQTSPLDAKAIMDAFLKRSMICGMHRPTRSDDLVAEATRAARRSDAVIIDWLLDDKDSAAAKNIIAGILEGDNRENGRLRLIVVYTSEPAVQRIAAEISARLGYTKLENPKPGVICGKDTRIVVLNKEGTVGGEHIVPVPDLPQRIVDEFGHLASGILSTFAVTAISAIRDATHHVLAIFSDDLDGAFLGHMCALKTPEDAREFALDLFASELRSVAALDEAAVETLSPGRLAERIDAMAVNEMVTMKTGSTHVDVPVSLARMFPELGEEAVLNSFREQRKHGKKEQPTKQEGVGLSNVGFLFHKSTRLDADTAHTRFARLSSFRTETSDRVTLPPEWAPTLMLGSLLVRLSQDGEPQDDGYLLCTQPRCDAIRLEGSRPFPFQTVSVKFGLSYGLVASVQMLGGSTKTVKLRVEQKPCDTRMITFAPSAAKRVKAARDSSGRLVFLDTDKQSYLWIGDLRDMVAQRTASMVAARLHEVGIDEYEWLRLSSKVKEKNSESG